MGSCNERAFAFPHDAYCISRMHAERLVAEGYRGTPVVLPGLYAGPSASRLR